MSSFSVGIPVFGEAGNGGTWALLNLVLVAIGVVLAVEAIVSAIVRNKREREKQEDADLSENNKVHKQQQFFWIVMSISLGIGGAALFLITQDLSKEFTLLDYWSIVHMALVVYEAVAFALSFKRARPDDKEGLTMNDER